jgi:hypothetical protein
MQKNRDLAWSLVSERAWSLAARHTMPPDCYAQLLDGAYRDKPGLVAELLMHAKNAYWLDRRRHTDPIAKELWRDCWPLHSKPVRMLFAFFERDGEDSPAAFKLLLGCIKTLADNKGVEELHHFCKLGAKQTVGRRANPTHLQRVILQSQVVEKRGIKHPTDVTQDVWSRMYPQRARLKYPARNYRACSHKLPKHWSRIMGPKNWRTTTEVEGRIAASAWHWLQLVGPFQKIGVPPLIELDSGIGFGLATSLFSRLLLPKLVVRHNDACWATLSRGKWGTLVWPLVETVLDNGFSQFAFAYVAPACAEWHHVLDVDAYWVVPYEDALSTIGIVLQQTGPSESLPKAALRKTGSITFPDAHQLCRHYRLLNEGFGGLFHGMLIRCDVGLESAFSLGFGVLCMGLGSALLLTWLWGGCYTWDWNRPSHWVLESYIWGCYTWDWNRPSHWVLESYIWDQRNAGVEYSRQQLLVKLADHLGGGDNDWITLVKADLPAEPSIELLAQDPLFELAWEEMEDDNKQELRDVKKAMANQRCKAHAKKRKFANNAAAAKAVAKAKGAPFVPPPILPVEQVAPVEEVAPGDAPVEEVAPGDAHPMLAPPGPRGSYEYVVFEGGQIAFSEILFKINAHCLHAGHQRTKCHLEFRVFHGSLIRRMVGL